MALKSSVAFLGLLRAVLEAQGLHLGGRQRGDIQKPSIADVGFWGSRGIYAGSLLGAGIANEMLANVVDAGLQGAPDPMLPNLALVRSNSSVPANEHGIIVSVFMESPEDGSTMNMMFDHGCKKHQRGDALGTTCSFKWGDKVTSNMVMTLATPIEAGSSMKLTSTYNFRGLLRHTVGKILSKPVVVECAACGVLCTPELPSLHVFSKEVKIPQPHMTTSMYASLVKPCPLSGIALQTSETSILPPVETMKHLDFDHEIVEEVRHADGRLAFRTTTTVVMGPLNGQGSGGQW